MQKQATVTQANFLKSFDGKYGTMYVHAISFDNGDNGEYLAKTMDQDKFVVGQSAEYTIEAKGEYQGVPQFKVKPYLAQQGNYTGGGGGYSKRGGNNSSFALSYAKDLAVAHIGAGRDMTSDQILKVAASFNDWLNANQ